MKNIAKLKYSIALVLFTVMLQAQESFPDDVQDVPVDDYLPALFILAVATAYWVLKPKVKA
ncbi:hypothetical protein [Flavobacterium sp.]|jgi:hypothetical protein|uniref:hypothetical protein n=1 Tax=Flavobacterium sp. TaxID=239 RepID=UPI0037BF8D44